MSPIRAMARLAPLVLAATHAVPAMAQARGAGDDGTVAAKLTELTGRIAELEAELAILKAAPPAPPPPAAAQAVAPAAVIAPQDEPPLPVPIDNVIGAPIDQPMQRPDIAAFQLTGGTDDNTAQLLLSRRVSRTEFNGRSQAWGRLNAFSLAASAPLSDEGPTNIGTLAHLDDGFAVKLRYTTFQAQLIAPSPETIRAAQADAKARCFAQHGGQPDRETICSKAPDAEFLKTYLGEQGYEDYQKGYFGKAAFAWGLEASVGYHKFDYLDPATAASAKTSRTPFGAKVFGAFFPGMGRDAITASAAFERSYEAADDGVLCPGVTPPLTNCAQGAIGGPSRKNSFILSLGERSYVPLRDFLIPGFAIAPSINYEVKDDTFGFDLPIYLVPDADGNLVGGIRFGYTSEKDKVSFGLFVGSTFSLFQ